jgi:Cu/Ag efflux protein CusF
MQPRRLFATGLAVLLLSAAALKAEEFRGRITKVDPAKKEVVVEGRGSTRGLALPFTVNSDTRIQVGREPAKLEDLQVGDRVRLYFENRNNQRVALSISDSSLRLLPALGGNAPAAAGAPSGSPSPAVPGAAPGPNTVAGRLIRVGLTEREIVLLSSGPQGAKETETTLLVPADVKITRDQKELKLEELKTGEQVSVRTEKRDGHLVAAAIQSGGSVTAEVPPANRDNHRIEKIRKVLRIADWILQQMDEQREEPK